MAMKFKATREQLLKPLGQIGKLADQKHLPIVGNVLLDARGNDLRMTATDMEIELSARIELIIDEAGTSTLPARKLLDILKALPVGADLILVVDGDKARLTCGRSRFSLATLPAEDFPISEAVSFDGSLQLPQREIKRLIECAQFAMANQDVRYYLNGLLLEVDGCTLLAVATDGHRLAYCEAQVECDPEGFQQQVIVPRKGVQELLRLLADVETPVSMRLNANHIQATVDDIRFSSKLIDGKFPDYHRVIPTTQEFVGDVIANRVELQATVIRTATLSSVQWNAIRFVAENNLLQLTAHNPEGEEAEDEIYADCDGDKIDVGFNADYLLDVLNVMESEQVKMDFVAGGKCLITANDGSPNQFVIMPMRL